MRGSLAKRRRIALAPPHPQPKRKRQRGMPTVHRIRYCYATITASCLPTRRSLRPCPLARVRAMTPRLESACALCRLPWQDGAFAHSPEARPRRAREIRPESPSRGVKYDLQPRSSYYPLIQHERSSNRLQGRAPVCAVQGHALSTTGRACGCSRPSPQSPPSHSPTRRR